VRGRRWSTTVVSRRTTIPTSLRRRSQPATICTSSKTNRRATSTIYCPTSSTRSTSAPSSLTARSAEWPVCASKPAHVNTSRYLHRFIAVQMIAGTLYELATVFRQITDVYVVSLSLIADSTTLKTLPGLRSVHWLDLDGPVVSLDGRRFCVAALYPSIKRQSHKGLCTSCHIASWCNGTTYWKYRQETVSTISKLSNTYLQFGCTVKKYRVKFV